VVKHLQKYLFIKIEIVTSTAAKKPMGFSL